MDEDIHRKEAFHSSLGQQVFVDLEQIFEMLKYSYQEKLLSNKDSFTFDGKCFLEPTDEILSIEIRLSIFEDTETMSPKFLVILRDTTQRDVIATLESNNKFKDNILSSLSHELKTPLNGIKALLDSSLQDNQVSEKTKRMYLKPAARSATLLGHVINDVLDYSLYNKKNLKMKIEKTDIKNLFTSTFELVRDHYYQHNITAMIEIDDQVPQFFHTDSARLTQVIINILSNAFKFTYEGTVLLTVGLEGKDIRITVKDTGVGMDAETKKKLGNILPESLAGTKINNTSTGAGLGLTISQITATILGPKDCPGIYFETKLNEGSVFTLLIEDKKDKNMMDLESNTHKMTVLKELVETHKEQKRAKNESRETETEIEKAKCNEDSMNRASFFDEQDGFPSSEMKISNPLKYISKSPSLLKLKQSINTPQLSPGSVSVKIDLAPEVANNEILVVDDEPINILAFEIMMKQFGKVIDKSYGGVEALEILKRRRQKEYKVIFMDLNMPGMDGFEVTRRIKERIRKKEMEDVRIVACTAYHEFEYKDKCLRAGMDDFISKPITKEQLGQILKKYNCL